MSSSPKNTTSRSHELDLKANKNGLRNVVFGVNGDEYIGEWKHNKRHGRGIYKWKKTNLVYEGDWEKNMRSGPGVLSVKFKSGKQIKIYSGSWKDNKRHGYGKNWYSENEIYEGEWCEGKRSGWGRMYYANGSIYEGQWLDDKRHGDGMLRLANENRFEGQWLNDKKNGRGKYFFLNTGQLMEGVWCNDVPKTSQIKDLGREVARRSTQSEIPEVGLYT
ncbi:MORN repeat-containing protein [Schistosoma japonicum]|uniref:MORN repeat-containing protein 3 n=1 Tax=Schistosoma japonicum TaxID=6182 RepID=A0A4Z2DRQ9_SCHJA|nr:MORN repeat-containing protein [Schistosoma japonicum]